jgi:hypothetical protein
MRFWLPALVVIAAIPASAHHPFTPYYDGSKLESISGPIVELRTVNPHVVVIIQGTGPDGRTGRWAFEGQPPNALYRRVPDFKERLKIGTSITISGWPAKDPQARVFSANTVTFADGTTLVVGSTMVGAGDGWQCAEGGRPLPLSACPYTYPAP